MQTKLLVSAGMLSLLASLSSSAHAQRYTVTDLGTLPGGSFSQATYVDSRGLVTGLAALPDGTQHAVLWHRGSIFDIAEQSAPGINSGAFAANTEGQVLVQKETESTDPNHENFCSYSTGRVCRAFVWQYGVLRSLPTLGGTNASPSMINHWGQIVGIAENAVRDPSCPTAPAVTGSGPLSLDFEAVLWEPGSRRVRELRPLPGDTVGMAFWINDFGQVVGGSGTCASSILPGPAVTPHAVLWEDGVVTDMGSLGGTVNTSVPAVGTIALSINNRGQAVGSAALPGNQMSHAFLWSKRLGHMVDLGTVGGDVSSAALSINEEGAVVGASSDSNANPRAFLFSRGTMKDLNQLVPPDSPIYMLIAYAINGAGQVAGFGVTATGEIHGFLASPCRRDEAKSEWCTNTREDETAERPRAFLTRNTRDLIRHTIRGSVIGKLAGEP